jgi:hypothetical protein
VAGIVGAAMVIAVDAPTRPNGFIAIGTMLFGGFGLFIWCLRLLAIRFEIGKLRYVVTDRRLLIFRGKRFGTFWLATLGAPIMLPRRHGSADIVFGNTWRSSTGSGATAALLTAMNDPYRAVLLRIKDPVTVRDMIVTWRGQAWAS